VDDRDGVLRDLPAHEARILLAHASGLTRAQVLTRALDDHDDASWERFVALAARRRDGEPIAYLVGRREFYGRPFAVDPRVLIPRPETELIVDCALRAIDATAARTVLDLGTGSGAIAVTIALERPRVAVTATDASAAALAVAEANASALGATLRFAAGDWFDALPDGARFDVIVSNPPYVAAGDAHLAQGDLRFEPATALTDGGDGLGAIRRIVAGAAARLAPRGTLVVEHGHDQAADVRAVAVAAGFVDVRSLTDLAGIERVVVAHGAD
jgi:release factor glutamine methyltransferase